MTGVLNSVLNGAPALKPLAPTGGTETQPRVKLPQVSTTPQSVSEWAAKEFPPRIVSRVIESPFSPALAEPPPAMTMPAIIQAHTECMARTRNQLLQQAEQLRNQAAQLNEQAMRLEALAETI